MISRPIDPPPASLAAPCWPGPPWPVGDATLGELLDIAIAREAAAAECRAKHARVVGAWPQ